jgi:hypothetical protein
MASADLEGGSRLYGQLADSDPGMRKSARSSAAIRFVPPDDERNAGDKLRRAPGHDERRNERCGSAVGRKLVGGRPTQLSVLHVTISSMCGN